MAMTRTPLARVRGLGSAKEGAAHWWAQRLTAIALVPLILWLVVNLIGLTGADQAAVAAWLGAPVNAALLILLVVATFHHGQLGLQVVVEDYVHHEGVKIATLIAIKFASLLLGAISVVAVLKLAAG
jgi:succinate dehydrogenase / fumarate reductase membrane anchor subunit